MDKIMKDVWLAIPNQIITFHNASVKKTYMANPPFSLPSKKSSPAELMAQGGLYAIWWNFSKKVLEIVMIQFPIITLSILSNHYMP